MSHVFRLTEEQRRAGIARQAEIPSKVDDHALDPWWDKRLEIAAVGAAENAKRTPAPRARARRSRGR